jgi:hypothetical protein
MKRLRLSKIIVFLLPALLLHILYPRFNQQRLFDFLAGQPILVSSFVWVPLLEISVLIVERIILPLALEAQDKDNNTSSNKSSAPVDNVDYLIVTAPINAFVASARKFVLPVVNLWQQLWSSGDGKVEIACSSLFPLLLLLPFLKQCVLRSNPSLPRGDPPPALVACRYGLC